MATRTGSKSTAKTTKITAASNNAAPEKKVSEQQAKPISPKDIDLHQYITVRNGFQGKLVYVSQKTGEHFVWDSFGGEQEMELIELISAKNTSKKFFINNWFMFDEDWVIDYLGLRQYYKYAIKIEDFDDVFKLTPAEIKKTISALAKGQKKSVAYRAKQLIAKEEIDSRKVINALEEALGIELIER